MTTAQRVRRAGLATAAALVIGGSGVAIGAAATDSSASGTTAAATATAAPAPATGTGPASYANVVRQVLPSVVLIRTESGLGSGVVLDRSGNIVTNAHVAGNATNFQVQVAGDTAPRSARLVGSYPPDDLAVIRADNPAGLQPATFGDSDRVQAGDVVLAIGTSPTRTGPPWAPRSRPSWPRTAPPAEWAWSPSPAVAGPNGPASAPVT